MLDIMTGVAILTAFACLLSLLSSSLTTRRIRRLAAAMTKVQSGQITHRVTEGGGN